MTNSCKTHFRDCSPVQVFDSYVQILHSEDDNIENRNSSVKLPNPTGVQTIYTLNMVGSIQISVATIIVPPLSSRLSAISNRRCFSLLWDLRSVPCGNKGNNMSYVQRVVTCDHKTMTEPYTHTKCVVMY